MESFSPEKTAVGIVGIGKMGTPMSKNLVSAGYTVYGYDVKKENVEKLQSDGVKVAESLTDLAGYCDILITMLPSSNDVEFVIGNDQILEKGKLNQYDSQKIQDYINYKMKGKYCRT